MDMSKRVGPRMCGTDFSIDRILSREPRSSQAESPSWLCCTRYRPPRLPRLTQSGSRCRRAGRHARVPFTATQAAALEAAYFRAPYLAPPALRALAAALQLRDDRIKIWFQNRRARERREKCTSIPPPQAVTLPATDYPYNTTSQYLTPTTKNFTSFNNGSPYLRNMSTPESSTTSMPQLVLSSRSLPASSQLFRPEDMQSRKDMTYGSDDDDISYSGSPLNVDTIEDD